MLSNILSNSELEKIQEFYNKGKPPPKLNYFKHERYRNFRLLETQ